MTLIRTRADVRVHWNERRIQRQYSANSTSHLNRGWKRLKYYWRLIFVTVILFKAQEKREKEEQELERYQAEKEAEKKPEPKGMNWRDLKVCFSI